MKKNSETAQLTSLKPLNPPTQSSTILPTTPSYYDEAYSTGTQDHTMVTLDTACTSHMFGNQKFLSRLKPMPPSPIHVASNTGDIFAHEQGSALIGQLCLERVIHSPELSANLVSAGMLYDDGYEIKWNGRTAEIFSQDGSHLLTFYRDPNNSRLWQIQNFGTED